MIWLVVVAVIVVLLLVVGLVLLFSPITVGIYFTYTNQRKDIVLRVRILRFIKFEKNIPMLEVDLDSVGDSERREERGAVEEQENNHKIDWQEQREVLEEVLRSTKDAIPHLKDALHMIKLEQWIWNTAIGVKSAHHTALITGALYTFKSTIGLLLTNYLDNETTPCYTVTPNYSKATYQTELKCILSFQIGQIMRELFSIVRKYEKIKKVGTK